MSDHTNSVTNTNSLLQINDRLTAVESMLKTICSRLDQQAIEKEWYTTVEVAGLLGRRQYTVQEKWCNQGRVECEKDDAGRWRIPGHEVKRLMAGGGLIPVR